VTTLLGTKKIYQGKKSVVEKQFSLSRIGFAIDGVLRAFFGVLSPVAVELLQPVEVIAKRTAFKACNFCKI
jgi:hypothetical protein